MDTEKGVTWQHFCEINFRDINFHDKYKKHEANNKEHHVLVHTPHFLELTIAIVSTISICSNH